MKSIYAVIMGFERYRDDNYFTPLKFAAKDASDFCEILIDENKCNIPRENVSLFIRSDYDSEEIKEIMDELEYNISLEQTTEDTILFFYSGYGVIVGDPPESYLVLPGTSIPELFGKSIFSRSGLSIRYLLGDPFKGLSSSGIKNKIFLIDCAILDLTKSKSNTDNDARLRSFINDRLINDENTTIVVALHKDNESKESKDIRNGIFTYSLITGLYGAAMGYYGRVTANSLIAYLLDTLPPSIKIFRYGKSFPRIEFNEMKGDIRPIVSSRTLELKKIYEEIEKSTSKDLQKPQKKLRVFLSYSSADKERVKIIYKNLSIEKGIAPWYDEQNLFPGQDWELEIRKAIKISDVVIVCLSSSSISKEGYIQKEIRQALDVADEKPDGTIFIIPLRLEECEVPERLKKWQWVDIFKKDSYDRLFDSLRQRASDLSSKNVGR